MYSKTNVHMLLRMGILFHLFSYFLFNNTSIDYLLSGFVTVAGYFFACTGNTLLFLIVPKIIVRKTKKKIKKAEPFLLIASIGSMITVVVAWGLLLFKTGEAWDNTVNNFFSRLLGSSTAVLFETFNNAETEINEFIDDI